MVRAGLTGVQALLLGTIVAGFPVGCSCSSSHAASDASTSETAPFSVTDLGAGRCYGISSDGHIVGGSDAPDGGPFVIDPHGIRLGLPLYESDPSTQPLAINNAGQIAGISYSPTTAILFENGGWSALAPASTGQWTAVMDIDEPGNIVGVGTVGSADAGPSLPLHAFFRTAGGASTDLGLVPNSAGYRIAGTDNIVGIFETDAGATHAFTYSRPRRTFTDVGTLGGANSAAYGANANGDIVGVADTAAGAQHAYLFRGGTMTDLGTLGGDASDGRGIDNTGIVVGNSLSTDGLTHPFMYRGAALVDILPTAADASTYTMARVEDIANGIAVGWGLAPDGTNHCLRWSFLP